MKNENKAELVRHGDLVEIPLNLRNLALVEISEKIPEKARKTKNMILALGEATGHYHEVNGQSLVFQDEKTKYIQVEKTSTITHQEHKTVPLQVGDYIQIQEREFDPFTHLVRMVKD